MEGKSSDQSDAGKMTNHNYVGAVLSVSVAENNKAPILRFLHDSENWRDLSWWKLFRRRCVHFVLKQKY